MGTRYRYRQGMPYATLTMVAVLKRFRDTQACIHFDEHDVWDRTIKALIKRGWIVQDDAGQERTFRITSDGLKALKVYDAPPARRSDGICPRCGERPTGCYSTGRKKPYCTLCESAMGKRQRELGIQYKRVRLCPDCKKRPVMVCSTGFIKSWCKRCAKKRAKKYRQSKQQRLLEQIKAGKWLPCPKCGKQRHHSANTVYDWCYAHFREYQNDYHHRKAKRKRA